MQGAPPISTTLVADVNDTGGKFAVGVNYTGAKLPPVSTTPAANLSLLPDSYTGKVVQKRDSCSNGNFFHWIYSYIRAQEIPIPEYLKVPSGQIGSK